MRRAKRRRRRGGQTGVTFRRTDHPGASRHPSSARRGMRFSSNAVGGCVIRLQPMESRAVSSRKLIHFALPFIELTEDRQIAIQSGEAAAIFENRSRKQIRINTAQLSKVFRNSGFGCALELIEDGTCAFVVRDAAVERREPKYVFRVVQTSVGDVPHETHNDFDILVINIATVFHPLADQSQHFQSAENNLMFSRP